MVLRQSRVQEGPCSNAVQGSSNGREPLFFGARSRGPLGARKRRPIIASPGPPGAIIARLANRLVLRTARGTAAGCGAHVARGACDAQHADTATTQSLMPHYNILWPAQGRAFEQRSALVAPRRASGPTRPGRWVLGYPRISDEPALYFVCSTRSLPETPLRVNIRFRLREHMTVQNALRNNAILSATRSVLCIEDIL